MRQLMTCLTCLVLATPAMACINDMELPVHESEFRSQYARPTPLPPPPASPEPSNTVSGNFLMGTGIAMLLGAAVIGFRGRARI